MTVPILFYGYVAGSEPSVVYKYLKDWSVFMANLISLYDYAVDRLVGTI